MLTPNRRNTLLVELIIVVLFFTLSSTVVLGVFARAYGYSADSRRCAHAMLEAQEWLELIYIQPQPDDFLLNTGFDETISEQGEIEYSLPGRGGDYSIIVRLNVNQTHNGTMTEYIVSAVYDGGGLLAELPGCKYLPDASGGSL